MNANADVLSQNPVELKNVNDRQEKSEGHSTGYSMKDRGTANVSPLEGMVLYHEYPIKRRLNRVRGTRLCEFRVELLSYIQINSTQRSGVGRK